VAHSDVLGDVSRVLEQLLTDAISTLTPLPQPIVRGPRLARHHPDRPAAAHPVPVRDLRAPGLRNRFDDRQPDPTRGPPDPQAAHVGDPPLPDLGVGRRPADRAVHARACAPSALRPANAERGHADRQPGRLGRRHLGHAGRAHPRGESQGLVLDPEALPPVAQQRGAGGQAGPGDRQAGPPGRPARVRAGRPRRRQVTPLGWRPLPGDRWVGYSPAWFRLLDEVTGQGARRAGAGPAGPARRRWLAADRGWRRTSARSGSSPTHGWSAAGRPSVCRRCAIGSGSRQSATGPCTGPRRRRRVRRAPHNDTTIPPAPVRQDVVLLPSTVYASRPTSPWSAATSSTRQGTGRGRRGRDADHGGGDHQADPQRLPGAYARSLRWVAPGWTAQLSADDLRGNRHGTITVTVPDDLASNQWITIA
jgi:hypothetical protein